MCTIIIVPLLSLYHDLKARLRHHGLDLSDWNADQHKFLGNSNVCIVTADVAADNAFAEAVELLNTENKLAHIVLDKVQFILPHAGYRPKLKLLDRW